MRSPGLLVALLASCSSTEFDIPPEVVGAPVTTMGYHEGPAVFYDGEGPTRFVLPLLEEWDAEAVEEDLVLIDGWHREPANDGYEVTIDLLISRLEAAGFSTTAEGPLRLEILEGPPVLSWTPRSGHIHLRTASGRVEELHGFKGPADRDRTLIPTHAPSASIVGASIALELDELDAGEVLLTERPLRQVLGEARERGAAAVVSAHLFEFNVDPTGARDHLDAIHYGGVPEGTELPCFHVSPRTHAEVVGAMKRGGSAPSLDLAARVDLVERPLRTVIATIVGDGQAEEVVACVAHVQEPGANDNATGIAGLLEGALALARSVEQGKAPRPARTLSFVWGDEFGASRTFLDHTEGTVIAGISGDMLGASRERTGAICLLERSPDPGALLPVEPDRHTAWGAGEVSEEDLLPNGLAVVMRCALVDVGIAVGGWTTSEHPWEGGSDHDVFLGRGIPGVLLWHFTDFTYHTSLDRLDRVDTEELRRTAVALVGGAAAVADARTSDLKRYIESALRERFERQGAISEFEVDEVYGELWGDWSSGTRRWLADLCNGLPPGGGAR